jgi:hypothetical protein
VCGACYNMPKNDTDASICGRAYTTIRTIAKKEEAHSQSRPAGLIPEGEVLKLGEPVSL